MRLYRAFWITLSDQIRLLKNDQGRTGGMGFYANTKQWQCGSHRLFRLLALVLHNKWFYEFEHFLLQDDLMDNPKCIYT